MNLYQTPDTRIASVLVTAGFPVASMEKKGGRVVFFFEREAEIDSLLARYLTKNLLLDAQSLLLEYLILKQRIANF